MVVVEGVVDQVSPNAFVIEAQAHDLPPRMLNVHEKVVLTFPNECVSTTSLNCGPRPSGDLDLAGDGSVLVCSFSPKDYVGHTRRLPIPCGIRWRTSLRRTRRN